MFSYLDIITVIRSHVTKSALITICIIGLLYGATRLPHLSTNLPIFSDEGIYIEWAKTAWHDASQRFVSLTDGRQPLQTWLTIPFLKLFPENALLAGRLFGVLGGLFSMSGTFFLLWYLWNIRVGIFGALLYIATPMFLLYDRMAMVDTWVAGFATWFFFGSLLLKKYLRLDLALLFGMFAGFGLLAKSSAQLFLALAFFAPLFFVMSKKRRTEKVSQTINYWILIVIASIIALAIYSIQRLTPYFHIIAEKNHTFILTPQEFLKEPFRLFPHHVIAIPTMIWQEAGVVYCILFIMGMYLLFRYYKNLFLYLCIWLGLPFLLIANFNEVLFPRYFLFLVSLGLIPAAYALQYMLIQVKWHVWGIVFFLIIANISQLYALIFDAKAIKLPEADGMYVNGVTAGYGMQDVIERARKSALTRPTIILAEGNFGLAGDSLRALTKPGDTFAINAFWPLEKDRLQDYQKFVDEKTIYVVYAQKTEFPPDWPLKLVATYTKPEDKSIMYLFELTK